MIEILSYLPSVGAAAAIIFSFLGWLERRREKAEREKEKEEASAKKLANADDVKNLAATLANNVMETKMALASDVKNLAASLAENVKETKITLAADVKKLADTLAEAAKETKAELISEIKELKTHSSECELKVAVIEERLNNQIDLFDKIENKVDDILNEVERSR